MLNHTAMSWVNHAEYHKENGTGYVLKGLETIECLLE